MFSRTRCMMSIAMARHSDEAEIRIKHTYIHASFQELDNNISEWILYLFLRSASRHLIFWKPKILNSAFIIFYVTWISIHDLIDHHHHDFLLFFLRKYACIISCKANILNTYVSTYFKSIFRIFDPRPNV